MKYFYLFILTLISLCGNSQVYETTYTYGPLRHPVTDSGFKLKSVCGTPKPQGDFYDKSLIYDSCNNKLLLYILKEKRWKLIPDIKNIN